MILYCTTNRALEVWLLDLAGARARPPLAPTVYALVSFEADLPRYYVGSSRRLTARLGAHFSFARSTKLRGHSGGGRLLAPVVARRRRALVLILETCPGATPAQLQRREQAWILAARRDNGAAALPHQIPAGGVPERGPQAMLAAARDWPSALVEALAGFFREPRTPVQQRPATGRTLNGSGKPARLTKPGAGRSSRSASIRKAAAETPR